MKREEAYFCICQDLGRYNLVGSKSLSGIYEGCEYLCTLLRFTCGRSVDYAMTFGDNAYFSEMLARDC